MRPFRIIPAMDLLEGSIVRLIQGDYARKTIYTFDPVELASQFLEAGLTTLHVVDLDGARSGSPAHLDVVSKVAKTGIKIEFGGGLRSGIDIERALDAGASEIILGTSLLENQDQLSKWLARYGGKLVAGIDSRDGGVAVRGWRDRTRIDSLKLLAKLEQLGFARAIVTDVATDGAMRGPNLAYLQEVAKSTSMEITASGGVARTEDIYQIAALAPQGISGVIVGRAFYEGAISITELAKC